MGGFGFVGECGGNFFDGRLAVAVWFVHVGLHGYEIDYAAKTFFGADGELQGDDVAAEDGLEGFHGALEAGEFAVHPGEDKGAGYVVLGAVIPNLFGGDLRADVGVDGDERGVGGDQRGFCFGDEGGISGKVEEIYFYIAALTKRAGPFGVGQAGLNRNFSLDFFFVPISGGATFRNFSQRGVMPAV